MAPFEQQVDGGALPISLISNHEMKAKNEFKSEKYDLEPENLIKGDKLLFGCLDIFDFWSPCPADSSATVCSDQASIGGSCTHSDNSASKVCDSEKTKNADAVLMPANQNEYDNVNDCTGPIILQSIISYPSSGSEPGMCGARESLESLDAFLTNHGKSNGLDLSQHTCGSELSFSYSSFSENGDISMEEEEQIDDNGSTGEGSILSFDPGDFLEDDEHESVLSHQEQGSSSVHKLGTIMECYGDFSSRTFDSSKKATLI